MRAIDAGTSFGEALGEAVTAVWNLPTFSEETRDSVDAQNEAFSEQLDQLSEVIAETTERTQEHNSAFNALYDCRTVDARTVNQQLHDGEISRTEAEEALALREVLMNEDLAFAKETNVILEARQRDFRVQSAQARQVADAAPPATRNEAQAEVANVEDQINTNQRVYQAAATDVNTAETQVASANSPFEVISMRQRRLSIKRA